MKPILVFLTTGFEEIEALATVDILRRAGLETLTVSLTGEAVVAGSHGIPVKADRLFSDDMAAEAGMLILPGGTTAYNGHEGVKRMIKSFWSEGGTVAAICASPMVLGGLGILRGRKATCYPGFEQYLEGAQLHTDQAVIVDGNVITGRGPGLAPDFALKIVEVVAGSSKRSEIARQLLLEQ